MTAPQHDRHRRPLIAFLRRGREVTPRTSIGEALALLQVAPHRLVPVVEGGQLVGVFTEGCVVRPLLIAADAASRAALRSAPVSSLMEPPCPTLPTDADAEALLRACDAHGRESFALVEGDGRFRGLIARSDLLDETLAPPVIPPIGGMATPLGVYLTCGSVSAGAGPGALILTGALACLAQISLYLALGTLGRGLLQRLPALELAWITQAEPGRQVIGTLLGAGVFGGGFLTLLRFSPLAGYHAAEHQVVHAIERGEPLLPESVRLMPREHPRCGTNFIAAMGLLVLGGALTPLLGSTAYLAGGLLALVFWRRVGGWLQRHFTTRTASDAQLQSGIQAASELLSRHARHETESGGFLLRLWHSGMAQLLLGYGLAGGSIALLSRLFPPLSHLLAPTLQALMD